MTLNEAPVAFTATPGFDLDPATAVSVSNTPPPATATPPCSRSRARPTSTGSTWPAAWPPTSARSATGSGPWRGLAVQREVADGGFPAVGVANGGAVLHRLLIGAPGTASPQAINLGAAEPSERLVAVAWRPATGQLLGLGIDASADTGTL